MPGIGSHGLALIARVVASSSQPARLFIGHTHSVAPLFMSVFLPSADRPGRCCRYILSLGNVSPHLLHSSKTHESRAMMRRWKLAKARSSGVMTLTAAPASWPQDHSPGPPGRFRACIQRFRSGHAACAGAGELVAAIAQAGVPCDRPRLCATIRNHLRTVDSRASAQKFAWRSMAG
jgi:hypothetical protein